MNEFASIFCGTLVVRGLSASCLWGVCQLFAGCLPVVRGLPVSCPCGVPRIGCPRKHLALRVRADVHVGLDRFLTAFKSKLAAVKAEVIATQVIPFASGVIFIIISTIFICLFDVF